MSVLGEVGWERAGGMVSVIGGGPGVMVNLEVGWRGGGRHGAEWDVDGTPWDALPWWEWTRLLLQMHSAGSQ